MASFELEPVDPNKGTRGISFVRELVIATREGRKTETRRICGVAHAMLLAGGAKLEELARVPYRVGERRWVRETYSETPQGYVYRADLTLAQLEEEAAARRIAGRVERPWRPARSMPRKASRYWVEVLTLKVQRVQDLTDQDAIAEGVSMVPFYPDDGFPLSKGYVLGEDDGKCGLHPSPRKAFAAAWDVINAARPHYSWSANPFVWVVGYRCVP